MKKILCILFFIFLNSPQIFSQNKYRLVFEKDYNQSSISNYNFLLTLETLEQKTIIKRNLTFFAPTDLNFNNNFCFLLICFTNDVEIKKKMSSEFESPNKIVFLLEEKDFKTLKFHKLEFIQFSEPTNQQMFFKNSFSSEEEAIFKNI